MVFNSAAFLFFFLPVVLLLDRLLPRLRGKNALLCALSIAFYCFDSLTNLPFLLFAALWSYLLALPLHRESGKRKLWLTLGLLGNLALLCMCKYAGFFLSVVAPGSAARSFPLPLGVSFFAFHALSYLIDCYRDRSLVERSPGRLLLYLSFFPRLIAGPIVKWKDGRAELTERRVGAAETAAGLRRFVRGLAKKLLLAEGAAAVVNAVYAAEPTALSGALVLLAAACYCLQLFFDFSGYSDMAIGLGQLFGFHFPENFNYPYISQSVSEFWRRWHITLNRWFVDYLYIPLGGSRRGTRRALFNRMFVFLLTGLWHGAGWTFLVWGLWHGLLVSLEGLFPALFRPEGKSAGKRALLRLYTLAAVLLGFLVFRADSLSQALALLGRLFCTQSDPALLLELRILFTPTRLLCLAACLIFVLPIYPWLKRRAEARLGEASAALELLGDTLALLLFVFCILAMAGGGYTPFIYRQF